MWLGHWPRLPHIRPQCLCGWPEGGTWLGHWTRPPCDQVPVSTWMAGWRNMVRGKEDATQLKDPKSKGVKIQTQQRSKCCLTAQVYPPAYWLHLQVHLANAAEQRRP